MPAIMKRTFDILVSSLGLVVCLPLFVVVAILLKLDSPGPVFFTQVRMGRGFRKFFVYKFRTMTLGPPTHKGGLITIGQDPRITRVGHYLRKSKIDELPQLFNVLQGNMSIVGPRPHALSTKAAGQLFREVVDRYTARHRVKPGITGWAQVNGWRGETDTVEKIRGRVEHDLYYIDNWSIWLDLRIIARTPMVLLRGRNAF